MACYDTLTGLLNRNSFKENLEQAIEQARRHGQVVATLFVDVDRFKRINDTLGHNAGDTLLRNISESLSILGIDCWIEPFWLRTESGEHITRLQY